MASRSFILISILFAANFNLLAQKPTSIKVKKRTEMVYFYQEGEKCDTISKNHCNRFYLFVQDSLKKHINIICENAQIQKTKNDSVFTVLYLPGLKYESYFAKKDSISATAKKSKIQKNKQNLELISGIDGVSSYYREKIQIKFIDKRSDKVLLENIFYGKN